MKIAVIGLGHIVEQFKKRPCPSYLTTFFDTKNDFETSNDAKNFDHIYVVDQSEKMNYSILLSVLTVTKVTPITISLTSRELHSAVSNRKNKKQDINVFNPYYDASISFIANIPLSDIEQDNRRKASRAMLPNLKRALRFFGIGISVYFLVLVLFGIGSSIVMHLPFSQGLYFSSTTLTSVGYGDVLPDKTKTSEIFFAMILQNIGNLSIACIGALFFEIFTVIRLAYANGHRNYKNKQHIIICGGGRLAFEICLRLKTAGQDVIVIEPDKDNEYAQKIRDEFGYPVYFDTAYNKTVLSRVNIWQAKALITTTPDDTSSYLISSLANSMVPSLHIIARIYDNEEREEFENFINAEQFEAYSVSSLSYNKIIE